MNKVVVVALAAAVLAVPRGAAAATLQPNQQFVLGAENNRLNAYDAATRQKRTIIPSEADDKANGLDINAEICLVPDGVSWKPAGETWFIAGEDTEQNALPGVLRQGWGLFRLEGTTLAQLQATEVGKLVPDSFVTVSDNPENYGCGVLPDGRIVTGDVGDQLPTSPATGQLIEWFPDAAMFRGPIGPGRTDFARVPHCKIDVGIGTAGGIAVDGATVYVASNRPNLATLEIGGIYRFDSARWPQAPTDAAGCGARDATGKPVADAAHRGKSLFIAQGPLALTPSDIVDSGRGTFYISSVFTGTITEYDRSGNVVRPVLVSLLPQLEGVTPYGLGVTADGALWIADIGVVGSGPAAGAGSVVRLPIAADGAPGTVEVVDEGLEFPDGIGVHTPRPRAAAATCASRRVVSFKLPRGATRVVVRVDGRRRAVVRRHGVLRVSLRGLPRGTIRVRITGRTRSGRGFTRSAKLRLCVRG